MLGARTVFTGKSQHITCLFREKNAALKIDLGLKSIVVGDHYSLAGGSVFLIELILNRIFLSFLEPISLESECVCAYFNIFP